MPRPQLFPELPTFDEAGLPGFEAATWFGVMTRAGVPNTNVNTLNDHINRTLRIDSVRTRLIALDADPAGGSAQDFAALLSAERLKWQVVLRDAGIKPG